MFFNGFSFYNFLSGFSFSHLSSDAVVPLCVLWRAHPDVSTNLIFLKNATPSKPQEHIWLQGQREGNIYGFIYLVHESEPQLTHSLFSLGNSGAERVVKVYITWRSKVIWSHPWVWGLLVSNSEFSQTNTVTSCLDMKKTLNLEFFLKGTACCSHTVTTAARYSYQKMIELRINTL